MPFPSGPSRFGGPYSSPAMHNRHERSRALDVNGPRWGLIRVWATHAGKIVGQLPHKGNMALPSCRFPCYIRPRCGDAISNRAREAGHEGYSFETSLHSIAFWWFDASIVSIALYRIHELQKPLLHVKASAEWGIRAGHYRCDMRLTKISFCFHLCSYALN